MRPILLAISAALLCSSSYAQQADGPKLAAQARIVLEKNCYRCHGQNGSNEGGFNHVLDFKQLREKKVVAGDPAKSRLFKRMGVNKDMPPEDEKQRPSEADIETVKKWIAAGAADPATEAAKERPVVGLKDELQEMRDYLRKADRQDRPYIRFFTFRHLHNMPVDRVREQDLRMQQAALSKLVNSVSWKNRIVVPEAAGESRTVYAVDIRKLDWDRKNLWKEIVRLYPYGLKHDRYPEDKTINDLASEVYELTESDVPDAFRLKVPAVRADWFVATASRPPLYHSLLQIPTTAGELERSLKVDVEDDFLRGKLARAGFNASGVSVSNRMLERHDALYGAYWKSYDFKTSAGKGNLFVFPLGPAFKGNDYNRHAFKHDGGEIIFNLPNGLQGYMLTDAKDKRIDAGPIEVVNDGKKTSGTPQVVNGLSCMSCHQHGMIRLKDQVRDGQVLGGDAREKIKQLYPPAADMDKLLSEDEDRFVRKLDEATGTLLKVGEDAKKDIRDFPEPISAIARWYLMQELVAAEAARELGVTDAKIFQGIVQANPRLHELGLFPLSKGNTVKREVWEFLENVTSPYQETARELKLGTPVRPQ